jgi:hypothetical protein
VTEELRALLRADLADERPPPLGDVVGAALRDGRRIRRRRRLAAGGSAAAVLLIAAIVAVAAGAGRPPGEPAAAVPAGPVPAAAVVPPGSVPTMPVSPGTAPPPRTVTIRDGTQRADGMRKKATSAAMLHLLTALLPPGRTSHYGVASDNDLHVQLYYDAGYGPSMLRLEVGQVPVSGRRPDRGSVAEVTVAHHPGNCVQDTVVSAAWPDGTSVRLDLAGCLDSDGVRNPAAAPAISETEAMVIAGDARWGMTMDAGLIAQGAAQFPGKLPEFA